MTININTVKIGDRVVITDQTARRDYSMTNDTLEPGKIYVISGVHKYGASGGTVSLLGEFNHSSPRWSASWEPGSFGYCLFKKAPEPIALEEATLTQIVEELRLRGVAGSLSFEVSSRETIDL